MFAIFIYRHDNATHSAPSGPSNQKTVQLVWQGEPPTTVTHVNSLISPGYPESDGIGHRQASPVGLLDTPLDAIELVADEGMELEGTLDEGTDELGIELEELGAELEELDGAELEELLELELEELDGLELELDELEELEELGTSQQHVPIDPILANLQSEPSTIDLDQQDGSPLINL